MAPGQPLRVSKAAKKTSQGMLCMSSMHLNRGNKSESGRVATAGLRCGKLQLCLHREGRSQAERAWCRYGGKTIVSVSLPSLSQPGGAAASDLDASICNLSSPAALTNPLQRAALKNWMASSPLDLQVRTHNIPPFPELQHDPYCRPKQQRVDPAAHDRETFKFFV